MFFKKQINDLSKKYKVITYDLRGHGDSEITNDGYTLDRYAKGFIPAIFAKSGCRNKEDLKWSDQQTANNSTTVLTRMWISMSSQDYRDVLPKITIPTLITYGEESYLYNADNSDHMRDIIKDSKLVPFPK